VEFEENEYSQKTKIGFLYNPKINDFYLLFLTGNYYEYFFTTFDWIQSTCEVRDKNIMWMWSDKKLMFRVFNYDIVSGNIL
jgi:hypothetical protein